MGGVGAFVGGEMGNVEKGSIEKGGIEKGGCVGGGGCDSKVISVVGGGLKDVGRVGNILLMLGGLRSGSPGIL